MVGKLVGAVAARRRAELGDESVDTRIAVGRSTSGSADERLSVADGLASVWALVAEGLNCI